MIVGILIACQWNIATYFWLWGVIGCTLATGLTLLLTKRPSTVVLIPALLLCAVIGGLLTTQRLQVDWTHHCPNKAIMEVYLTETPVPREKNWRAKAKVNMVDNHPAYGEITLFLRKDSTAAILRYGDHILLHGKPDCKRRYIYITDNHYILTKRDSTTLRAHSERLRMSLLQRMRSGPLNPHQTGVAEALSLGWRGDLEEDTQAAFRDAGLAHLLAVSGLHVGLLASIVGGLLVWVGKERRGRIIRGTMQLIAVWLFALFSGLSPATIRAALMFSLFIIAQISTRRTPTMNLLAASAILTLAANPLLLKDIGWQLSYSAVTGIVLAKPVITAFHNKLWQLTAVSTFATLATLPIVATCFHRLPIYFLIANIIIVPLAGVMLFFSLAYLAVPCIATAWPLHYLIGFSEWLTTWVSSLPGAVVAI